MLTLLLCTATSLPGRVVSAVERDVVVHVGLDLGDGYAVAEEPSGLWIRPLGQYSPSMRWPLPISPTQESTMRAWLLSHVGSRYGYAAVLVGGIHLLTHVRLSAPEEQAWDCSGAIACAAAAAGYTPFAPAGPRLVTPADWHRLATRTS